MLKELIAAVRNPFAAKKRPAAAPPATLPQPVHMHSFSCPCAHCVQTTDALTKARLKGLT